MEEPTAPFDENVPGFPRCMRCRYRLTGPIEQCVTCAYRALTRPDLNACGTCDQALQPGERCGNRLCRDARRRQFTRVHAIGLKDRGSPLGQTIHRYKYRARTGWSLIFARLVLGWLEQTMDPADIDLIVASPTYTGPPEFRAAHTEPVIDSAAVQDTRGIWAVRSATAAGDRCDWAAATVCRRVAHCQAGICRPAGSGTAGSRA